MLYNQKARDYNSVVSRHLFDLSTLSFDQLPHEHLVRAFGVEYAHVSPLEGGDLYVTRFGWPYILQLLPENWFAEKWYVKHGEKLKGSTGSVYHVISKPVNNKSADLVVKFSRVAQEVPLMIATTFPDDVSPEVIANARFNSPMEEFGLVTELREGVFGLNNISIRSQRPLAIYTPPEQYQLWQLGRKTDRFHMHRRLLAESQESTVKAIELDIKRIYVLLYGWIKGQDAEQYYESGDITENEFHNLTPRVISDLKQNGFHVLDNKPKHFILRKRRYDGKIIRQDDQSLMYALVDYELLQRTPEHQKEYKRKRREHYFRLQSKNYHTSKTSIPTHLKLVEIFGVKYIYGTVQDGGKLWVVGQNPDLFDYFVPDRWRRTSRIKLSLQNEVYRTQTRDNILVVYRRSRVGSLPRMDPLTGDGKRIREHGYNSPFEEVLIAERLRQMGISTTFPRAIYQTGHQSTKAVYLQDSRRFEDDKHLMTPDGSQESVLVPDYDYYTIWNHFRGFGPESHSGNYYSMDLEQGRESGLLNSADCNKIKQRFQKMLLTSELKEDKVEDYGFSIYLDEDERVCCDENGNIVTTFGINALTAYEIGLLSEELYRKTIQQLNIRLRAADCEKLDLKGSHVLLSMDPDGQFKMNEVNNLQIALCNFEFIKGLYRPIR